MMILRYILASISLCFSFKYVYCIDVALTVDVGPGMTECFYEDVTVGAQFEVQYQVLSGGEMDAVLSVETLPSGDRFFIGDKRSGNVFKSVATLSGTYVFCLDNSFSHISKKTIYFELYVSDPNDATAKGLAGMNASPELDQFEVSLDDFRNATNSVETHLQSSIHIQRQFATEEVRDRSIQEYNFERINFWSGVQLFIMVSVALVNILMIRGFFDDRKRVTSSGGSARLRT